MIDKTAIQIFLALVIGNFIGYQLAKWRFYGEVDLLFWKITNPNVEKKVI